jgi:hypothetical protein
LTALAAAFAQLDRKISFAAFPTLAITDRVLPFAVDRERKWF